jgi:hypothetical protein
MPNRIVCLISILLLTLTGFTRYTPDEVINYYGIPETLSFDNTDFNLSWSAHPNDSYYKQEYLPKGESVDHFNNMVLIDFIVTEATAQLAANAQVNNLIERKKTDPICNYQILKSPDGNDYILDFVMSEGPGDNLDVIEWNAYHYKPYTDKAGHKGVLLFAVSRRTYADKCVPFLKNLRGYKAEQLNKLVKYPIPEITVK